MQNGISLVITECFLEARAVPRNPGVFSCCQKDFLCARKYFLDGRWQRLFPRLQGEISLVPGSVSCVTGSFSWVPGSVGARERILGTITNFLVAK